jgi:EAL domain-containing protein (putative c-di-GMP-specific phosphodiesterase class I)
MYRAKGGGGQRYRFYAADMGREADEHLRLEALLQRALERQELVLHYQPQFDGASGRVIGLEALLRWQPRGKELLLPDDFLAVAEETGLIVPIGEWVLSTALAHQAQLRRQGWDQVGISVNMSARQFHQPDLADQVGRLLEKSGCAPSALTLEITEDVLTENPETAAATMARLAAMGVRLALDDFGTGSSSLSTLRRFPVHGLKIDQSFVADLETDDEDAAIVAAVIALARSMKLDVIAEGVETRGQVRFLADHGCQRMQGFHFSRPLPAADLDTLLRGRGPGGAP